MMRWGFTTESLEAYREAQRTDAWRRKLEQGGFRVIMDPWPDQDPPAETRRSRGDHGA